MADVANKYPENVAGKYYVDNQCIDCDLCRETAPDNFKRNEDGGYSYVSKQPASPEEESPLQGSQRGLPGRGHWRQRGLVSRYLSPGPRPEAAGFLLGAPKPVPAFRLAERV
jgi:ferredoxin